VSTEAFYETDPSNEYKRGFSLQCISPLPIVFAEHVGAQGHWGETLREYMRDYAHWSTFGAITEFLPQPGNRVTLADETDQHGIPVADLAYSMCENDHRQVEAATRVMTDMHKAAGAAEAITINRYAHLIGGARMADDERSGVVDANLRTFAVPNLYITDGSVLPTQGSANPALTIMALAARAGDHLASGNRG
jgi:choline dehydrogenase-like flavoprotein